MADDKLRQELLYMVRLASKYDFSSMEVVEGILRLEKERKILDSVFGKRFKERIFDIAGGKHDVEETCVICGQHAENKVICNHCMETIGGSEYAKSLIENKETEEKPARKFPFKLKDLKRPFQIVTIACLTLILFLQLWIFGLWISIPSYNPKEKERNSAYEMVPVSTVDEGYAQLVKDFPEEDGYTVTFAREDVDYTGRFLLNPGDCCLEIEDNLSDEERYNYFFTDEVFVYYISYLEGHTSKQGIAEINKNGAILIEGSFNDGRRTDSFYKFR